MYISIINTEITSSLDADNDNDNENNDDDDNDG